MTLYNLYYQNGRIYACVTPEPEESYHVAQCEMKLDDLAEVLTLMQAAVDTNLALNDQANLIRAEREDQEAQDVLTAHLANLKPGDAN